MSVLGTAWAVRGLPPVQSTPAPSPDTPDCGVPAQESPPRPERARARAALALARRLRAPATSG